MTKTYTFSISINRRVMAATAATVAIVATVGYFGTGRREAPPSEEQIQQAEAEYRQHLIDRQKGLELPAPSVASSTPPPIRISDYTVTPTAPAPIQYSPRIDVQMPNYAPPITSGSLTIISPTGNGGYSAYTTK